MAEAKVPDEVVYDPYKLLLYKKAIRKGKERENTLRINIIGNYAQGKTSLANRLMGKTCEGVTTTNGIEINRHKCQTFDDGSHTFTSFENENQDFVNRVATVARSIEQTIRSNTDETHLEENLKYDYSEQNTRRKETPQDQKHVHMEAVASKLDEVEDFVQLLSPQIPEVKEKKPMALSPEEMATFSNEVEVQKDEPEKFIDIWDFGGQYIFYATHTLFHSRRALYLLVFDLTKSLDTIVLDEEFPGETGDRNMDYFARFWLESIHAYTGHDPQVILVGTHKDKLHGNDLLWKEYFENVRCLFYDTELIHHIQKEDFAVDNYDMSDPVIAELLEFILKKHQELVQHVEIPARWIQLEKSLRAMKTSMISFQELIELDKRIEYPLQDEEQLKLFLHYHHEKGSLFFYDEDQLSDSICLDPKFLVDAFKCIITSEHFFKNDPDVHSLRTTLSKEGRLSYQLIDLVWSKKPDFLKHKEVILGFLKKQNIISEVVECNAQLEDKKQKDWFIVPSLLKDPSSKEEVTIFLARKRQSQVRYAMKFDTSSILNHIFHRALAAALGVWPVVNCGKKQLLFENLCVFKLTWNHTGLLEQRKDSGTIELRVIHLQPKQVESQAADEFRRFVESVVQHEFRRLKYPKEEKDKPFVPAYRCNHADHCLQGSSQLTDFKQDEDIICPDNITHGSFDDERAKKEWFAEYMVAEVYPKMYLTEKTLSKLAQVAIGANWSLLGPELQINEIEIDHIKGDHTGIEMQIYTMLLKWKERSAEKATLDVLAKAIKKCPGVKICWDEIRNIRDEYLRKQEKQEIDITRPLSNKTVTVNETLTLEFETNKPNVSVTWLKDDKPIKEGGNKTMLSNGGLHKLIVEDVKVEDAAKYTCTYGNSITECFVKIEDTDGPLKFLKELSDIEVGDLPCTETFSCVLNTSQVEVEWYYGSQRLYPSNKYALIDEGSTHMLKITGVSEYDEGKYSVLAKDVRSEATLYVEETEEERYLLAEHRKRQRDTDGPLKFLKELSDIEVGDLPCTETFSCVLNTSQVEVEWYYGSQRLYPSNKYALIDEGSTHMLKITGVSEYDEGKYSVLAKDVRSEATLYVEETEEERYLLAEHRKRQRVYYSSYRTIMRTNARILRGIKTTPKQSQKKAHDDSEQLKRVSLKMAYSEPYDKWIETISRSDEKSKIVPAPSPDAKDDEKFCGFHGLDLANYLYRVLNPLEDITNGIVCKDKKSPRTVEQHIASGSKHPSRFISTTLDLNVAALWAFYQMETPERKPRDEPLRIVKIHIKSLVGTKAEKNCINLCDKEVREHFIKGATHRSWAISSKEVLFQYEIPKYGNSNDVVYDVDADVPKPPQPPAKKPKQKKGSLEEKMAKLSL